VSFPSYKLAKTECRRAIQQHVEFHGGLHCCQRARETAPDSGRSLSRPARQVGFQAQGWCCIRVQSLCRRISTAVTSRKPASRDDVGVGQIRAGHPPTNAHPIGGRWARCRQPRYRANPPGMSAARTPSREVIVWAQGAGRSRLGKRAAARANSV